MIMFLGSKAIMIDICKSWPFSENMKYWIFAAYFITVLYKPEYCDGYPDATYTWPLSYQNSVLQIQNEVAEGKQGCSVTSGIPHYPLQYDGIHVTGSATSYVEVIVNNFNEMNDFAFTVHAKGANEIGGTILHYKQDDNAVDVNERKVKNLIIWYNQSHVVAEQLGPNDETYGFVAESYLPSSLENTWVGFSASFDRSKPKLSIMTSTGINTEGNTQYQSPLGLPGRIRVGSSFFPHMPAFCGYIICLNMHSSKLTSDEVTKTLNECVKDKWDPFLGKVQDPESDKCVDFKGYFEIRNHDSAIDTSVTSLDSMATVSRVKCADLCMRTEACKSFTINKIARICKVFDADYSSNIITSSGTSYYMTRDL